MDFGKTVVLGHGDRNSLYTCLGACKNAMHVGFGSLFVCGQAGRLDRGGRTPYPHCTFPTTCGIGWERGTFSMCLLLLFLCASEPVGGLACPSLPARHQAVPPALSFPSPLALHTHTTSLSCLLVHALL